MLHAFFIMHHLFHNSFLVRLLHMYVTVRSRAPFENGCMMGVFDASGPYNGTTT